MEDLKGKLPDDFPGKAALEANGITTHAQLRKAGDVTALEGIGPATKEKIDVALAATGTDDDKLTSLETTAVSPGEMAAMRGSKSPLAAADTDTAERLSEESAQEKLEEDNSNYGRLTRSGYVLNENHITGERWVGESIQRDPNADQSARLRTTITPIAEVRPFKGLQVRPRNGEPFVVSEEYDKDASPADWLGMLIPGTKDNFIAA